MIDETTKWVLIWIGYGLLIYFGISYYSLLRYALYRDQTRKPSEWPRLNRWFEYYNAYPAALVFWVLLTGFDLIERLVRRIKPHTSIIAT